MLTVFNMRYWLLKIGSRPIHPVANTRMNCPQVKSSTLPGMVFTQAKALVLSVVPFHEVEIKFC